MKNISITPNRFFAGIGMMGLVLLVLLAASPAWAQKGTLSLTTDEDVKSGDPISNSDLPTWLAGNTNIQYSGDEAIDVVLLVVIVEDGKVTQSHLSGAISVDKKSAAPKVGDHLPKADWFPGNKSSGGGNKAGFFDWLWGKVGWGPSATPPRAPSGAWAGWTVAQCNALKNPAARSACLAAVTGSAPLHQNIPTNGTVVVVMPALMGDPEDGFKTEGMLFTLADGN